MANVPRQMRWQDRVNAGLERWAGVRVLRTRPEPTVPVRPPADPEVDRLLRRPVFLCSSVRSGSTLLRAVLNSHSHVHAPHETHFRRLGVVLGTAPVRQSMKALDLNNRDLEHLLWDRLLHRELVRSGKRLLVEKTPSNVFAVDRLATAWPDARFLYLIRHPFSIARSWHESDPGRRPMERSIPYTLNFMEHVERARQRWPGPTVRYEDLTADPGAETRRICAALDLPWEAGMLTYGDADQGPFVPGIGDWSDKIRTGTVQPGRPLPDPAEIPPELLPMCRAWGY